MTNPSKHLLQNKDMKYTCILYIYICLVLNCSSIHTNRYKIILYHFPDCHLIPYKSREISFSKPMVASCCVILITSGLAVKPPRAGCVPLDSVFGSFGLVVLDREVKNFKTRLLEDLKIHPKQPLEVHD